MLQYIVGMVAAGSPVLHLYINNVTPDATVTLASFNEATSSGYAYSVMASANWTTTQTISDVTTALKLGAA